MASEFKTGLKIWLILLLGGLVMLPFSIMRLFIDSIMVNLILLPISLVITFFIYGWLFIKFKKWIFKR